MTFRPENRRLERDSDNNNFLLLVHDIRVYAWTLGRRKNEYNTGLKSSQQHLSVSRCSRPTTNECQVDSREKHMWGGKAVDFAYIEWINFNLQSFPSPRGVSNSLKFIVVEVTRHDVNFSLAISIVGGKSRSCSSSTTTMNSLNANNPFIWLWDRRHQAKKNARRTKKEKGKENANMRIKENVNSF